VNRVQCKARLTWLGTSQRGRSNAAMRPIHPLPFGLIRNPASAALSSLAREQPLPALSALHPSGLRINAFRRHSVSTP
jgi:hypothetical protein